MFPSKKLYNILKYGYNIFYFLSKGIKEYVKNNFRAENRKLTA